MSCNNEGVTKARSCLPIARRENTKCEHESSAASRARDEQINERAERKADGRQTEGINNLFSVQPEPRHTHNRGDQ